MNKNKAGSVLGNLSWKSRKNKPDEIERLRKMASLGGKKASENRKKKK